MRVLGLDSSGLVASVAVLEDENLLAEYTVNYKKTHSQTLLPMLDTIVQMIELDLKTVDVIAVANGPGSFTGLRIGTATAKGLGLALECPLVGVPTVDGLAYNLVNSKNLVCPIMDARRNQTYTGIYEFEGEQMNILKKQCAVGIDEIVKELNQMGRPVTFLGDGVSVFKEYIKEHAEFEVYFAPAHLNKQRAGAIAALGAKRYLEEGGVKAAQLRPDYLRLSQAERERMEKEQKQI